MPFRGVAGFGPTGLAHGSAVSVGRTTGVSAAASRPRSNAACRAHSIESNASFDGGTITLKRPSNGRRQTEHSGIAAQV